ncbi:MAG: hypothetical protein WC969_00140 [Elusimicrobiota bacterium]|jgi:hypothetical protein
MNEEERKALHFSRDLEAVLSGKEPGAGADRGALSAARALAGADLARECRVRSALRARLLERGETERRPFLGLSVPARALAAACAAALLLMPFLPGRIRLRAPRTALAPLSSDVVEVPPASEAMDFPRGPEGLPMLPGRLRSETAPGAQGPFEPLPLTTPFETRPPAGESPFEAVAGSPIAVVAGSPISVVAGRETALDGGRAVVWEFEGATFALESRPVSIEDIFGKPEL